MNTLTKIFSIFKNAFPDHTIDEACLIEYIEFCITHNVGRRILHTTSQHHILPASKSVPFEIYSNLTQNVWNCAHLTYSDHYKAHYLLSVAIPIPCFVYSFTLMHNKDVGLKRITKDDLLPDYLVNQQMRLRNEHISKDKLKLVEYNGEFITKAKLASIHRRPLTPEQIQQRRDRFLYDNMVYQPGIVEKIRNTKTSTIIDGKNLDQISSERAAKTMSKEYINEQGEITTIYRETAKKISVTVTEEFIDSSGNITTIAKQRALKGNEKRNLKSKKYMLKNVFDDNYCVVLYAHQVRLISPGLETKTRDNYLGKSKYGANYFNKKGTPNLIGLYVEKLL